MNESIIKKIFKKLVKLLVSKMRKMTNCVYRFRLKNNDFTLIASNCNGTFLLYDLKLKYNTPTVDLWIPPTDFIRFCSNLPYYLNVELSFVYEDGVIHPIGLLDDVKVYFTHYNSCTEAKKKWDERKKRVNYDNIFFLMAERDGCSYKNLQDFDNLSNENKLVLTHKDYPELKSTYKISGFESNNEVGLLFHYKSNFSMFRYMYDFGFIKWLNSNRKS